MHKDELTIREELREEAKYENEVRIDPLDAAIGLIIAGVIIRIGIEVAIRTPWIARLLAGN